MKPLVFLGSGISLPSGLPDTSGITEALFADRWKKHTDSNFYPKRQPSEACSETRQCQAFLQRILKSTASYYKKWRGTYPNYEDLFFLVEQLERDEQAWDENAAVEPFRTKVKSLCKDLCKAPSPVYVNFDFQQLCEMSLSLIQSVVWHELRTSKEPVGLDLLESLAAMGGNRRLTVCTLNHDLLVERFLTARDLDFSDGFGRATKGLRRFKRSELRRKSSKVRLLKLHGSINWFLFRPDSGDFHDDFIGIPIGKRDQWRTKSGDRISDLGARPHFLTGSYNKLTRYNAGIFLSMMHEFELALAQHSCILMSGYGWADKGINMRLKNWLWEKRRHRIVILHCDPQALSRTKALCFYFDDIVKAKKIVLVPKWLCQATMADVTCSLP